MRRRRQRLQVSTFPFLAVLLCAMGALILLLLVLDRRARVVAMARAREPATSAAVDEEKVAAARQAEWQQRRQALHDSLSQELRQLHHEAAAANEKMQASAAEFTAAQTSLRGLEAEAAEERNRLAQLEGEMATRRSNAAAEEEVSAASRSELERMARELRQFEQTLADLKTVRQRQQQTYLVVPYRGRHGDNRQPIYVECTTAAIIFHPDRERMNSVEIKPPAIHDEIERRLAQHFAPAASNTAGTQPKPYLLLLVRPDGILTYTRLLAALRALNFDYGYEFIEQDWALDFPNDDPGAPRQPETIAGPAADKPNARGNGVPFQVPREGSTVADSGPGSRNERGPGLPDEPGPEAPFGGAASPLSSPGREPPPFALQRIPETPGAIASHDTGRPAITARSPAGGDARDRLGPSSKEAGGRTPAGTRGAAGLVRSPIAPAESSVGKRARPEDPTRADQEQSSSVQRSLSARTSAEKPSRQGLKTNEPPTRSIGSREWIVAVECLDKAVIVRPGGQRIATADMRSYVGAKNPLEQAVRQLIDRRQATVQPGDPPYRVQIRFLIRPDGLQSYYLAYPVLAPLNVPMMRQNVEEE